MMKILAISGSLREASSNTAILKNLQKLAPANVEMNLYFQAGELPHFSPDIDKENVSETVKTLRNLVKNADGILICTPEYAFGVPGSLKNALDWLVSSGELNTKPVAAITASPLVTGGNNALASLQLTLMALGTNQVTSLSIGSLSLKMNAAKEITDQTTQANLEKLLATLMKAIQERNIVAE